MSDIQTLLNQIRTAIYGRDVRQAIHDAIRKCYDEGKAGATDLTARELAASQAATAQAKIDAFETTVTAQLAAHETAVASQLDTALANLNTTLNTFIAAHGTVDGTLISETVLYEASGSASGPTALLDVTQAQFATYDYIDIYYKSAGTWKRLARVTPEILEHTTNLDPIVYTSGEKSIIMLETKVEPAQSGTKFSISTKRWAWNGAASAAASLRDETTAAVGIYKIVGIKHISTSATKDAELSDLRIGPDGATYQTAGAMIRGELAALKERLDDLGLYRDASGDLCEEDE